MTEVEITFWKLKYKSEEKINLLQEEIHGLRQEQTLSLVLNMYLEVLEATEALEENYKTGIGEASSLDSPTTIDHKSNALDSQG